LEAVKVSDFVVFVMSAEVEVDELGTSTLTAIKSQGVPLIMGVVQHLERQPVKMQAPIKKSLLSYMDVHFPGSDAKLYSTGQAPEAIGFLRNITSLRPKGMVWRDKHAYMVADEVEYVDDESLESGVGTLKVTGYIRGSNLSANRLIHIQNLGDFQISKITSCRIVRENTGETIEPSILQTPNPELQDSLIAENEPDPMDNEQTWPTEEELADAERRVAGMEDPGYEMDEDGMPSKAGESGKKKLKVPKGMSAYQAAWIADDEDEEDDDEEDDDDEDGDAKMSDNDDEDMDGDNEEDRHVDEEEEFEEIEAETKKDDFDLGFNAADDERQYKEYLEQKKTAAEDDLQFPDEVETPRDIPAHVRFGRYRGLKSFRTSPWDPYENLPVDYARIFQFENFKRTRARIFRELDDEDEGIEAGRRVVVWIQAVPKSVLDFYTASKPFVIFSLLPHEHKFTMSTFNIHRIDTPPTSTQPAPIIKSKDPMILIHGFRKLVIRPLYSADSRGSANNVHRFERFLHHGRTVLGSFYGPIGFTNEPILMFRPSTSPDGEPNLNFDSTSNPSEDPVIVGTGHLVPPTPTRVIAKRIILTGHPFKIHKRSAVIRYMFFNPRDIEYFKPIQLYTKLGRIGHIKESLGTHGYMKCLFDEQIKGQDTICMALYKRVFPKWGTSVWVDGNATRLEEVQEGDEDVKMDI
jgi:pre-rRNA-processing protein TSR1